MANITGSIQVRPIYTPTSRQALFPPPITRTPPRCNTEVGLSFVYQEGGISRQIWSLDMSLSVCTPAPIAVTPLNYQRRHDIVCALQLYLHGTQSVTEANIIPGSWTLPWKNGLVFSQSFQIPMGCCHPNYRKALEGVGIITWNGVPSSRDVSHRQFWVINWTPGWANKHFSDWQMAIIESFCLLRSQLTLSTLPFLGPSVLLVLTPAILFALFASRRHGNLRNQFQCFMNNSCMVQNSGCVIYWFLDSCQFWEEMKCMISDDDIVGVGILYRNPSGKVIGDKDLPDGKEVSKQGFTILWQIDLDDSNVTTCCAP